MNLTILSEHKTTGVPTQLELSGAPGLPRRSTEAPMALRHADIRSIFPTRLSRVELPAVFSFVEWLSQLSTFVGFLRAQSGRKRGPMT